MINRKSLLTKQLVENMTVNEKAPFKVLCSYAPIQSKNKNSFRERLKAIGWDDLSKDSCLNLVDVAKAFYNVK